LDYPNVAEEHPLKQGLKQKYGGKENVVQQKVAEEHPLKQGLKRISCIAG